MASERWGQKGKSRSWQSTSPSSPGCARLGVPPAPLCLPHHSSQHALTSHSLASHFLPSFRQAHHVWLKEESPGEFIRVSRCLWRNWRSCRYSPGQRNPNPPPTPPPPTLQRTSATALKAPKAAIVRTNLAGNLGRLKFIGAASTP